ncbi:MAG: hypothetical protein ACRBBV_16895 [Paracoccaceae bacterium]
MTKPQDNKLDLGQNPTPADEADDFSSPDERADARSKNHEIELLKVQMGPIGKLIGSTDSSKTIAFVAVGLCLISMIIIFCVAFDAKSGTISDGPSNILSLLASIVTGCIGFIFGTKQD